MPDRDRTGPMGYGPRAGRGAGWCGDNSRRDFPQPVQGAGWRSGYQRFGGRGRGWRHEYYETGLPRWAHPGYAPPNRAQELSLLKDEAGWLKSQFEQINRRIQELEQKE
jgi:Family of unknown function (DUF5320)